MGLLSGGAAALFGELLAPLYLPATLSDTTDSYDTKGTLRRGANAPRDCLVQVDRCTERMTQAEGYTDTDRAMYILATSLEGDAVTGQEIEVHEGEYAGTKWRLAAPIDRDPATAYWLARGARVKGAPGG